MESEGLDGTFNEKQIEDVVNDFMDGKLITSLDTKIHTMKRHNNARPDTVYLIYTIMYND